MTKMIAAAGAVLLLGACGTQMGDRLASGAAIGAGAGVLVGGAGALAGAAIGAGFAALTDPNEVNLGEPVWSEQRRDYVAHNQPR
jgi:hypothetical protein